MIFFLVSGFLLGAAAQHAKRQCATTLPSVKNSQREISEHNNLSIRQPNAKLKGHGLDTYH